jgi:hypothetical protein
MSNRLLISSTQRLGILSLFFLIQIPIALFELHYLLNIPINSWLLYCPLVPVIGLSILLYKGSDLFFWISYFLQAIWIAFHVSIFLDRPDPNLAYILLLTLMIWWITILIAKHHFQEPYVQPSLRWFQSLPEPIPSVVARIDMEGRAYSLGVGGINQRGIFLFFTEKMNERIRLQNVLRDMNKKKRIQIQLESLRNSIELSGRMIRFLSEGRGFSLELIWKNNDALKEYRGFLNELREKGYVD